MSTGAPSEAAARRTARDGGRYADGPRLLADVGGTHARFALEYGPGDVAQIGVYPCAGFPSLIDVIEQYLRDAQPDAAVRHAAVAIANPVEGDQVQMTNHAWHFSIEATRRALGCDTLLVVNDFTALALALPQLTEAQRLQVGGGVSRAQSVIGLVGAGTGLGASGLVPAGDRWIPLRSEGGHASFAPLDDRDAQVLDYARREYPEHVSYERLASGPGIELIYRALAGRGAWPDAAEIVLRARAGEAPAMETVDCFCGVLGNFAGNVALTLGAFGGVYVGGGVVPKLGELFTRSSFRARFEAKGRFAGYLSHIPTYVVTADYPAFLGASALLAEQLDVPGGAAAVFERMRRMRDALTPAERRVADFVLARPRTVVNGPIADIARWAGVSQPTVVRFCRALGCRGLSDFKLKLAAGLAEAAPAEREPAGPARSGDAVGATALDDAAAALLQLRAHLDADAVERAVRLLSDARRIAFYGVGHARVVAQEAHYTFLRFGIPAAACGDPCVQTAAAPLLGADDVVVAVSESGRAPELRRALDAALRAGARVVAITSGNTPLAKKATVALVTGPAGTSEARRSTLARILHLAVVDLLAAGVANRRAGATS